MIPFSCDEEEPTEKTFERLENSIKINECKNIHAFQIALSDKSEEREFTVSNDGFDAYNSLGNPSQGENFTRSMVQTSTFDEFKKQNNIPNPTIIKIDVEGWEIPVLNGMKDTLSTDNAPLLIVEFTEENAQLSGYSCSSLYELISSFEINHVHKKGAVYDEIKLSWISGQHMMRMGTATILEGIHEINREWGQGYEIHYLYSVLDQLKQRSKSLRDFIDQSSYFFNDPDSFDEKSSRKNWKDDNTNTSVNTFKNYLENIENWNSEEIESALRHIAEENEISAGKLIHPTRLALSGVPSGPSLFAMMELLGKDVCIRRLNKALETFPQS